MNEAEEDMRRDVENNEELFEALAADTNECEYGECQRDGIRHLSQHYFCNEHNEKLRQAAQQERPERLHPFVERKIEESKS